MVTCSGVLCLSFGPLISDRPRGMAVSHNFTSVYITLRMFMFACVRGLLHRRGTSPQTCDMRVVKRSCSEAAGPCLWLRWELQMSAAYISRRSARAPSSSFTQLRVCLSQASQGGQPLTAESRPPHLNFSWLHVEISSVTSVFYTTGTAVSLFCKTGCGLFVSHDHKSF